MLGFKFFSKAIKIIAGIEAMYMIKKGQLRWPEIQPTSAAQQFYLLAMCSLAHSNRPPSASRRYGDRDANSLTESIFAKRSRN